MLDMMAHAVITSCAALWAALSAVLGLMVGAVAAHPLAAAVAFLYASGWIWLISQIRKAPTNPPGA